MSDVWGKDKRYDDGGDNWIFCIFIGLRFDVVIVNGFLRVVFVVKKLSLFNGCVCWILYFFGYFSSV